MQTSKILLSREELSLAQNTDWILTKNAVIKKVVGLYAHFATSFQHIAEQKRPFLPDIFFSLSPKISKGEQHQGLPYVMLDYPRVFSREDTLAIRCFFWWGNFISLTLQLKGNYKNEMHRRIYENLKELADRKFYLAISDDEWRHDFEPDNYVPIADLEPGIIQSLMEEKEFLKIATRWPILSLNNLEGEVENTFGFLVNLLS